MKRIWPWCALVLLSLGSVSLLQAQQATGEAEKAVLALETQWMQSQQTNNPDLVVPLLAEKYRETLPDGRVRNKAESMAVTRATKYSKVEWLNLEVTGFGNAAIATSDFKGQGTDESGKPFSSYSRWTDTWVKMPDGKWQCVSSHGSNIEK